MAWEAALLAAVLATTEEQTLKLTDTTPIGGIRVAVESLSMLGEQYGVCEVGRGRTGVGRLHGGRTDARTVGTNVWSWRRVESVLTLLNVDDVLLAAVRFVEHGCLGVGRDGGGSRPGDDRDSAWRTSCSVGVTDDAENITYLLKDDVLLMDEAEAWHFDFGEVCVGGRHPDSCGDSAVVEG